MGVESRDFSHAENERIACKAEQIPKMITTFTQKGPRLSCCEFPQLCKQYFLSQLEKNHVTHLPTAKNITDRNLQKPKTVCMVLNPNWHEGWYFYLLVLSESDFVSWILIKNFRTFLNVKIDIKWVNLTPCQAHWVKYLLIVLWADLKAQSFFENIVFLKITLPPNFLVKS